MGGALVVGKINTNHACRSSFYCAGVAMPSLLPAIRLISKLLFTAAINFEARKACKNEQQLLVTISSIDLSTYSAIISITTQWFVCYNPK
jgi:hypothetical protein